LLPGFRVAVGWVKGRAKRGRLGDAGGALEAAGATRKDRAAGVANPSGTAWGWSCGGGLLAVVGVVASMGGRVWAGRQPDLPMALRPDRVWPGDKMIDGLTPRPAEGAAAQSHWAGPRAEACFGDDAV